MWNDSCITPDPGAAQRLLPQLFFGFPQAFAVAPSVNPGLGSLPPERRKFSRGLSNMMRNVGGAVGMAVSAAIPNDVTNFHVRTIRSHLTAANASRERYAQRVSERYAASP